MIESFIYIGTGSFSAVLTYVLHNTFHYSNVKASALPALILGLVFYLFPNLFVSPLNQQIPIVFFGASFAGMASAQIAKHYLVVVISGGVFAMVYQASASFFDGFGGALGATAFVSFMATVGVLSLLKRKRFKKQNKLE